MTALDAHVRGLITHHAAPLIQAIRTLPASQAIKIWRELGERDREIVVIVLAAICPANRDPFEELRWLTDKVRPEHSDVYTESPAPLRIGRP